MIIFLLVLIILLRLHRTPAHTQEIAAGCVRYSCRDTRM